MSVNDELSRYADAGEFKRVLSEAPRSFRVNTLKINVADFLKEFPLECERVPWLDYAFTARGEIGKTIEHACGYLFVQSLSSMLPSLCLAPKAGELVLDSCASPGAKTTHMSQLMNNEGGIAAIESSRRRHNVLVSNCNRFGCVNTACFRTDATHLKGRERFDKVLVDAPCSCLGTFDGLEADKRGHERLQLSLLKAGYRLLKRGGELVYSTCTFREEENEAVVQALLESTDAELFEAELPLSTSKGLSDYGKEFARTRRVYPSEINSEAFFIAKVVKP